MKITGFSIQRLESPEALRVYQYAVIHNIPYSIGKYINNYIPIGDVDWCEAALGEAVIPDYFPMFLWKFLNRKIWSTNYSPPFEPYPRPYFIKPADKYKRFDGKIITNDDLNIPLYPWICSNIVKFTDEWRYYVLRGKIIDSGWYLGDTPDAQSPIIDVDWGVWSGAVDFGLVNGQLQLVEAHHPFACGWYTKNIDAMIEFFVGGWEEIQRQHYKYD